MPERATLVLPEGWTAEPLSWEFQLAPKETLEQKVIIGLPFVVSAGRLPNLNRTIQFVVGTLSILFGGFLMYQIGIVDGLF